MKCGLPFDPAEMVLFRSRRSSRHGRMPQLLTDPRSPRNLKAEILSPAVSSRANISITLPRTDQDPALSCRSTGTPSVAWHEGHRRNHPYVLYAVVCDFETPLLVGAVAAGARRYRCYPLAQSTPRASCHGRRCVFAAPGKNTRRSAEQLLLRPRAAVVLRWFWPWPA